MYTKTGVLKGQLRVWEGASSQAISLKELYQPLPYVLRVYILKGISIMPKDSNGYIRFNFNSNKLFLPVSKEKKKQRNKEK